jgi:Xaa-Pro aminopeptidase
MPTDRFVTRRNKLLRALHKTDAKALLVTNFTNVSYLTGFSGDDSWLLVSPNCTILISDSRYQIQLAEECPDLDMVIRSNRQPIVESTVKILKKAKLPNLGFESDSTTVAQWETLQAATKSLELVPIAGLVEELREIKDAHELASLRKAVRQAQRGFAVMRASLKGDMTELEFAHDLEHAMRGFGARAAGFDPIVAVGPRAALPHANPTSARISEADLLLIDWGAMSQDGYRSDLTRVLVTGRISSKLRKIYEVVLKAQLRGIAAIRPGVTGKQVDAAARSVIEKAGYGKQFGHGLGHGIGLDIHEGTRLSPVSKDVLKPGMVITVEPGIYIPGWGGVRIEDDILVTRDGHEVLTSVPKQFEDAILG